MGDISFNKMYRPMIISLCVVNMYPASKIDRFWTVHFLMSNIILGVNFAFNIHGMIYYIRVRDFIGICGCAVTCALFASALMFYLVIFVHRKNLNTLINLVKDDFKSTGNLDETENGILLEYALKGRKLTIFWTIVAGLTGAVHPARALLKMAFYKLKGDFQCFALFEYFHPDIMEYVCHSGVYYYIFWYILTFMFVVVTCIGYMGVIPLCVVFTFHACGQLEIIINRVNKLFPADCAYNPQIAKDKLTDINKRLINTYSFIELINSTFAAMYDFLLKVSSVFIPITLLMTQKQIQEGIKTLDFVNFIFASLVLAALICFSSSKLQDAGENLRNAVYMSGWENHHDMSARRTILIMLTRAMRPTVLHTMFVSIDLDLFSDVCHGILNRFLYLFRGYRPDVMLCDYVSRLICWHLLVVRQSYVVFNLLNTVWN